MHTSPRATSPKSRLLLHLVRIQGIQNPEEVVLNHEVIAVVANQMNEKRGTGQMWTQWGSFL
jgi:hypothetical protein